MVNTSKFKFEKLSLTLLGDINPAVFVMLKEKVAACKSLELHIRPSWIPAKKSLKAVSYFLKNLRTSVIEFSCNTTSQKLIVDFVNSCTSLRRLNINTQRIGERWSWTKHLPNRTVKELVYEHVAIVRGNLIGVFTAFPELQRLSTGRFFPPLFDEEDGEAYLLAESANPGMKSEIQYLETSYLPPLKFMQKVKEILVHVFFTDMVEKLLRYVPKLEDLEKVDFRISPMLLTRAKGDCVIRLILSLAKSNSLREVKISTLWDNQNYLKSSLDATLKRMLLALPESVRSVKYKNTILR
jgi:hypothetical protein